MFRHAPSYNYRVVPLPSNSGNWSISKKIKILTETTTGKGGYWSHKNHPFMWVNISLPHGSYGRRNDCIKRCVPNHVVTFNELLFLLLNDFLQIVLSWSELTHIWKRLRCRKVSKRMSISAENHQANLHHHVIPAKKNPVLLTQPFRTVKCKLEL